MRCPWSNKDLKRTPVANPWTSSEESVVFVLFVFCLGGGRALSSLCLGMLSCSCLDHYHRFCLAMSLTSLHPWPSVKNRGQLEWHSPLHRPPHPFPLLLFEGFLANTSHTWLHRVKVLLCKVHGVPRLPCNVSQVFCLNSSLVKCVPLSSSDATYHSDLLNSQMK